jgi:hypothetical protein
MESFILGVMVEVVNWELEIPANVSTSRLSFHSTSESIRSGVVLCKPLSLLVRLNNSNSDSNSNSTSKAGQLQYYEALES